MKTEKNINEVNQQACFLDAVGNWFSYLKSKISIEFKWNIRISKDGYRHIPALYLAHGKDGFILSIPFINIMVRWGKALNNSVTKTKG